MAFRLRAALAVAVLAAAVLALQTTPNMVQNPGAEDGMNYWNLGSPQMYARAYASSPYLSVSSPGPSNRGDFFLAGAQAGATTHADQTIDMWSFFPNGNAAITAGTATYLLQAWLGGFDTQGDYMVATWRFYNNGMGLISTVTQPAVSVSERGGISKLILRQNVGSVPSNARYLIVNLDCTRTDGTTCDGYADNLNAQITYNDFCCVEAAAHCVSVRARCNELLTVSSGCAAISNDPLCDAFAAGYSACDRIADECEALQADC